MVSIIIILLKNLLISYEKSYSCSTLSRIKNRYYCRIFITFLSMSYKYKMLLICEFSEERIEVIIM